MIAYIKAKEEHIMQLAELRSMVLMETNNTTKPRDKKMYYESNLSYLKIAIPSGEFTAWIAVDGTKIIATSGIIFYRIAPCKTCPNGKVGYIQNMYTLPKYRRNGIAHELLKITIEEAKVHDCTKVMLNASEDGRPLYEKFDFKDSKNEMVLYLQKV